MPMVWSSRVLSIPAAFDDRRGTRVSEREPQQQSPPGAVSSGEVEFPEELRQQLFPNYPNQQQIDRFFATLGRAISAWQLVETTLYLVYEAAIKPQIPGAAASAFHALQTTKTKLTATDAAVVFTLLDRAELFVEWKRLNSRVDTKKNARNKLVHFLTYVMVDEKKEDDKIRLEPQLHDFRHVKKPQYKLSDITARAAEFTKLANDLYVFAQKLHGIQPQAAH
jgi:hypothetical protein